MKRSQPETANELLLISPTGLTEGQTLNLSPLPLASNPDAPEQTAVRSSRQAQAELLGIKLRGTFVSARLDLSDDSSSPSWIIGFNLRSESSAGQERPPALNLQPSFPPLHDNGPCFPLLTPN